MDIIKEHDPVFVLLIYSFSVMTTMSLNIKSLAEDGENAKPSGGTVVAELPQYIGIWRQILMRVIAS